jgi:hypothetical protein
MWCSWCVSVWCMCACLCKCRCVCTRVVRWRFQALSPILFEVESFVYFRVDQIRRFKSLCLSPVSPWEHCAQLYMGIRNPFEMLRPWLGNGWRSSGRPRVKCESGRTKPRKWSWSTNPLRTKRRWLKPCSWGWDPVAGQMDRKHGMSAGMSAGWGWLAPLASQARRFSVVPGEGATGQLVLGGRGAGAALGSKSWKLTMSSGHLNQQSWKRVKVSTDLATDCSKLGQTTASREKDLNFIWHTFLNHYWTSERRLYCTFCIYLDICVSYSFHPSIRLHSGCHSLDLSIPSSKFVRIYASLAFFKTNKQTNKSWLIRHSVFLLFLICIDQ